MGELIDTEYVKGMFHTGQYELNEDIVEGEFDRWLASVKAEAWDQGADAASPYTGGYLRSILVGNPYRTKQGD